MHVKKKCKFRIFYKINSIIKEFSTLKLEELSIKRGKSNLSNISSTIYFKKHSQNKIPLNYDKKRSKKFKEIKNFSKNSNFIIIMESLKSENEIMRSKILYSKKKIKGKDFQKSIDLSCEKQINKIINDKIPFTRINNLQDFKICLRNIHV